MRSIRRLTLLVLALFGSAQAAEDAQRAGFVFEMTEANGRFSIPDVPELTMREHPLREWRPHLRYLGTADAYTVSLMLREREEAAPRGCIDSGLQSVAERSGVAESRRVSFQTSDTTTVVLYSVISHDIVQLSAHVLSGSGAGCVEAHVSKIADSPDETARWLQGFRNARFEAYP